MPTLNDYMQEVQRLIRDQRQQLVNPEDVRVYVNEARQQIAIKAQCLRALTPISGAITTISVTDGGSGYVDPTVTIDEPDFPSGTLPFPNGNQATATATVVGGVITSINVTYGGAGYFQPAVTITDSAGSGAEATANVSGINILNAGQEVYSFADADLSAYPGYGAVYMIKSVSLIYSNYRYSLPCYSFSVYQAKIRQYPFQYQWVPTVCGQFGQGTSGSFYVYPLPSQAYQMEWDCFCLPEDLETNASTEALPEPWTKAVKFYAAHLAFLELQNMNAARAMLDLFDRNTSVYSTGARPGRRTNPYGRWAWLGPLLSSLTTGVNWLC